MNIRYCRRSQLALLEIWGWNEARHGSAHADKVLDIFHTAQDWRTDLEDL